MTFFTTRWLAKALALTAVGLVTSVIALEIVLQVASVVVRSQTNSSHQVQPGEFVIVTLGESTTAGDDGVSWPSQLQVQLNDRYPQAKIEVINQAVIGTNSTVLLSNLEKDLKKLRPQVVIAMMGINDLYLTTRQDSEFIPHLGPEVGGTWFSNLKTSRLIALATKKSQKLWRDWYALHFNYDDQELCKRGEQMWDAGDLERAERYLQRSLSINSKDTQCKIILAWLYRNMHRYHEAEALLLKGIAAFPDNTAHYIELANMYRALGRYPQAQKLYQTAIKINPNGAWGYLEYGNWMSDHREWVTAELLYQKSLELDPTGTTTLVELGNVYREQKKFGQAREQYLQALSIDPKQSQAQLELATLERMAGQVAGVTTETPEVSAANIDTYFHPMTQQNYARLLDLAEQHDFDVIAVQYPLRDAEPLRQLMTNLNQAHPNVQVEVVDNNKSFQAALQTRTYSDLFIDQFGGEFGHCTQEGYGLIAREVGKVLTKITVFPKK